MRFIDIHNGMKGIDRKALEEAHKADLDVPNSEGVKFLHAWADPKTGKVFCLSDGAEQGGRDARPPEVRTQHERDLRGPARGRIAQAPVCAVAGPRYGRGVAGPPRRRAGSVPRRPRCRSRDRRTRRRDSRARRSRRAAWASAALRRRTARSPARTRARAARARCTAGSASGTASRLALGERLREPAGRVAARAHVALERDVRAARARDAVGAVDELLAVVRPAAFVVRLAGHHDEAAIDVALDLEQLAAARRAAGAHERLRTRA